eukprot:TRINITY_DN72669_c0_g1_i1.p1 TRINITY_DN72669_c0_g1~~TRINITY_DN72669_c0_g1_i1.p1  ORF type:complete len:434 (+),score=65.14 TRINITY_DN72669_c0_g1_i1:43-1302(+)
MMPFGLLQTMSRHGALVRSMCLYASTALLLTSKVTLACTQVLVPSPTGEIVVANTVESGDFVAQHGGKMVHPTLRGERLGGGNGTGCGGDCVTLADASARVWTERCAEFTAKYGFVGSMNEKGLVVGHHMLALSVYEDLELGKQGICARDVDQWLLATFASVDELVTALNAPDRPRIIADPEGVPDPRTFTWGVVDAVGSAIVIEFVKGDLRVHNNTVGVLTNDPTWEWHVANLNNYAALQHTWYAENNAGVEMPVSDRWYPWRTNAYDSRPPSVPAPIGHGFNLLGLPGDGSGASRFVKVFFQRAYALLSNPPQHLEDALILGQELLNTVYKVKGTIPGKDRADPMETTPVATLSIPATREVYHRGRADMTWRRIDLKQVDFAASARKRHARVVSPHFYSIDVTRFLVEDPPHPELTV